MNQASKPYFLLSFIPALAYWYLETYYTLEIALIGGIILGGLEMIFEKKFSGHIHTMSKLNFGLIAVLGSISLIAQEGLFFKLQPTFTGFAMGGFLLFKRMKKQSLMVEMLKDFKQKAPMEDKFYMRLELHMALFLMVYSLFMIYSALYQTTGQWLFWKTGGFYLSFGAFMIGEMIAIRIMVRRGRR